ncbi:hypothetical protein [Paraburkholderia aromaticivorans]|uniref:hypothetical protein n=1 Tax=Paraburkholderia aromaticivorans TaxID=2026199 RepID=UPI0038BC87D7
MSDKYNDIIKSIKDEINSLAEAEDFNAKTFKEDGDLSELIGGYTKPYYVSHLLEIVSCQPYILYQTPAFEGNFYELLSYALEECVSDEIVEWMKEQDWYVDEEEQENEEEETEE